METMDTFNIILIALIFTSLVIIIGIFGKNLKKFREAGESARSRDNLGKINKKEKKLSFSFIFSRISEFFVWIAETIVRNARKALQNAHSGLIEIKSKKTNKNKPVIQMDKDVFEDIEESGKVPRKDRRKLSRKSGKAEKKNVQEMKDISIEKKAKKAVIKNVNFPEKGKKNRKLTEFFHKGSVESKPLEDKDITNEELVVKSDKNKTPKDEEKGSKKGFFGKINPFKKETTIQHKKMLTEESFNDYSDGIMKVRKRMADDEMSQNESSINGVVRLKNSSKREVTDDELGIDRKILEKKILQKIASNPKDIEGYRQLGELYIKMRNFEDAQSAYKFILRISARDADASRKLEKIKLLKRLK